MYAKINTHTLLTENTHTKEKSSFLKANIINDFNLFQNLI